jgi:hypothetical protein
MDSDAKHLDCESAPIDLVKHEQKLRDRYYRDRSAVRVLLDEIVPKDSELEKTVERFWWYRGEDEEIARERKMKQKMAQKQAILAS